VVVSGVEDGVTVIVIVMIEMILLLVVRVVVGGTVFMIFDVVDVFRGGGGDVVELELKLEITGTEQESP